MSTAPPKDWAIPPPPRSFSHPAQAPSRDQLLAEIERLRAAVSELVLLHDIGGDADRVVAAWEAARDVLAE